MLRIFTDKKKSLGLVLILSGLVGGATTSFAISGSYITAYSNFHLPSNTMYNIDMPLKINIDPGPNAHRFFSQQLAIGPFTTYIGLQTDTIFPNGSSGKGAVFSIWNATSATAGSPGSWCQPFGGEGIGYSCRIPYAWTAGNTYRLRVWQNSTNSWTAYVKDLTSGVAVQLGIITIPTTTNPLLSGGITTFTEWYGGDFSACSDLKLSQVTWGMPVGNNSSLQSTWGSNSTGPGACASLRTSTGTGPTIQSIGE